MANIGHGAYKSMLDWSLKVSTIVSPGSMVVGLSLGAPTSVSGSEMGTGTGYTRQAITFGQAATPGGSASASNNIAASFGTWSSSVVLSGIFLTDSISSAAGNMLWYGTINPVRTPLVGDTVSLAAGGLGITLA